MASTPSPAQLRQLIFKFYQDVDPTKLQMGLDINGIVEWTMRNGVEALNLMLKKQFNKTINFNEQLETAKDNFKRVSVGLSLSTSIAKQEHETRMTLAKYFTVHDKKMISQDQEEQFDKLVKFAMLNGLDKLSQKLEQKYKAPVTSVNVSNKAKNQTTGATGKDAEFGHSGSNPFGLDKARLRSDLRSFYEEMEDEEQLEVLDELTDWACEIGIEEFNKKVEQLYGQSLNGYLKEVNKPIHVNKTTATTTPATAVRKPSNSKNNNNNNNNKIAKDDETGVEDDDDDDENETDSENEAEVKEQEETSDFAFKTKESFEEADKPTKAENNVESSSSSSGSFGPEFDTMSEAELKEELRVYYLKHDKDNLEQLDQVCQLARKLGRAQLNAKLKDIYNEILTPISKPDQNNNEENKPPGLGFATGLSMKYQPGIIIEDENTDLPPVPPRITVNNNNTKNNNKSNSIESAGAISNMSAIFNSSNLKDLKQVATLTQLENEAADTKSTKSKSKVNKYNTEPVIDLEQLETQSVKKTEHQVEDTKVSKEVHVQVQQNNANIKETEFQKLARAKQERNQTGRSEFHIDGVIVVKNMLIDVCSKYRLDIITGICVCGFSKSDHSDLSKYTNNVVRQKPAVNKVVVLKNNKNNDNNSAKNVVSNAKNTSVNNVIKEQDNGKDNKKLNDRRSKKKKNWGPA